MSAVAQALTAEEPVTALPYLNGKAAVEPGFEAAGLEARRRSASNSSAVGGLAYSNGKGNGMASLHSNGGVGGTVTPPRRQDSLDPLAAASREGSPELSRTRRPSSPTRSPPGQAPYKLEHPPQRSSSVSPRKMRQSPQLRTEEPLLPPPPVFSSPLLPASSAFLSPSEAPDEPPAAPFTPRLNFEPPPEHPQEPSTSTQNTISASSTASNVTSNSSHLPPPPANANLSPYPPSNASFVSIDPETTASLIQNLYARLDAQGVPGDGWDEGKERSRDGIIARDAMLYGDGPRPPSRLLSMPMNPEQEAKADHVLRRVDRYGFFSNSHPAALACQHNRLATLSATPFTALPTLKPRKRTSSKTSPPPSPTSPTAPPMRERTLHDRASTVSLLPSTAISPETTALETKRITKWSAMLSVARRDPGGNAQDWVVADSWWAGRVPGGGGGTGGKYRKLQRRVFKGIPDRWRRAVWGLLMEKMASEVAAGKVQGFTGERRVPSLEELKREYEALLQQPSVQDVQIDLDVPRTISGHVLFHTRYGQGQRALFHVLHAFGLRSEAIGGYCQGMGPIAATLLCYFEPERAYAGLCRLFDQYQLGHIFAPGFPGLVESFYVQERLVELLMPDVHAAFAEHFISTSAYATKWYITLFANSVPFATQLRLWDGLLLEGVDFLVITAVAIIWHFQQDFTSPSASFESILSRLSSYFFVESDDALLRWIRKTLRLKGLRGRMSAWREEWRGFVRDGTSGDKVT
ncbi:hypothetical protein JCM8097_004801 [Rhodosporidiobolus ruineniae]